MPGRSRRFVPDLRPDETDKLKAMIYQVLETLIQDQAVRMRLVVSTCRFRAFYVHAPAVT